MRKLITIWFLCLSSLVTGQTTFRHHMKVTEVKQDTTIIWENVVVWWGWDEGGESIEFLYNNTLLSFYIVKSNDKDRVVREWSMKTNRYRELYDRSVGGTKIYLTKNQWGEIYLITVRMINGFIIHINRVDDDFPHYYFQMVLN